MAEDCVSSDDTARLRRADAICMCLCNMGSQRFPQQALWFDVSSKLCMQHVLYTVVHCAGGLQPGQACPVGRVIGPKDMDFVLSCPNADYYASTREATRPSRGGVMGPCPSPYVLVMISSSPVTTTHTRALEMMVAWGVYIFTVGSPRCGFCGTAEGGAEWLSPSEQYHGKLRDSSS